MLLTIILLLTLTTAACVLFFHCCSKKQFNLYSQINMLIVFLYCLLSPLFIPIQYAWTWQALVFKNLKLSIVLHYDLLTWVMLCLVSFVSLIIHSYATRYLRSDQNQKRFMGQLSLLTFSVILLMLSGSLFTAFIAWQFIGLSLYLLLNHYHYDVKANKAAKKKFMINRVGDICFLLAVIMSFQQYGTTTFTTLFQHASHFNHTILVLVFIAIMTKSAQFPFHIWLIDTMEAPTPVSALMHAGVINAGGFLLARLSPLYDHVTYLLLFIFLVGAITALLGNFFMQHQPDIKKRLAYSTVSQMGYMIMQCGLGCFTSALFHLIAHGFFKASLFLSAGNRLKKGNLPSCTSHRTLAVINFILTIILITIGVFYFRYNTQISLNPLLWLFIAISIFQLLNKALSQYNVTLTKIFIIFSIGFVFTVYLLLLKTFNLILTPSVAETPIFTVGWSTIAVLVVVSSLCVFFYKSSTASTQKIILQKIYLFGFHKGNIERFYRRYAINPMRRWGDFLLGLKPITIGGVFFISMATFFFSQITFIIAELIFLIFILLIANRVAKLSHLLITLSLMIFGFTSLAFGLGQDSMNLIGHFHWLNSLLIIAGFFLLLLKSRNISRTQSFIQNRLPWSHFYMSLFLMLLIGIPGTANFITEFYLLSALLEINIFLAVILGASLLLLALVVLHSLQIHFFNPKTITQYAVPISPNLHGICITIIAFNIFNGLYPAILLQQLSNVIGG